MSDLDELLLQQLGEKSRALTEHLARAGRVPHEPLPAAHILIGPRYAAASLPDDDYDGWHWKCSCGAEASPWIQNWPQSADEAREEWRLHFD